MFTRFVFRIVGVVLVGAGLFITTVAMKERARFMSVERTSERVIGIVVGHERPEYYFYEDRNKFAPVIQYETLEGDVRRFTAKTGASRSAFERGKTVDVLVRPCPTGEDCEAELAGGFSEFASKYLGLIMGAAFLLAGGGLVWKPPSEFGDGHIGGGSSF